MADPNLTNQLAKPVHIQRLERSLRLEPFLDQVQDILRRDDQNSSDSAEVLIDPDVNIKDGVQFLHGVPVSKEDRVANKCRLYNFEQVGEERAWLKDVLLSDSSSNDSTVDINGEETVNELLYLHQLKKKYQEKFYKNPKNRQFMYYSAGLLSKTDIYQEHKLSVLNGDESKISKEKKDKGNVTRKRKKKPKVDDKVLDSKTLLSQIKAEPGFSGGSQETKETLSNFAATTVKKEPIDFADSADFSLESDGDEPDGLGLFENMNETGSVMQSPSPVPSLSPTPLSPSPTHMSPKGKKKKERSKKEKGEKKGKSKKEKGPPSVKALIAQRRKLWILTCKKEISKASKARVNNHKEELVSCKRAATGCMRVCRLRAMQSQKAMKEIVWRAKRLTREMQAYWKRYDRVEKVQRRQAEKEAEEQRKLDVELMEARRQQRKLNYLITQTELYAHFIAKKLGNPEVPEHESILSQLDEEANPQLAYLDDYNSQTVKQLAMNNVNSAFHAHQQKAQQFDSSSLAISTNPLDEPREAQPEHAQPNIFRGSLKTYQLKGMNWIANMYDNNINGILADEMGLGKTVQSIAFLAHIAERYGKWGPFLVISPASTLHNWQQEFARFVPNFKVIPYWGSPQERKILRKFWDTRNLKTPDASLHVVVTSYQLIVTDFKYFNRIKWEYMVLDEAQAIKSASSARWKMLLGFNCRNRLLLSGTPIQNSMAELWALLHFIMPTLFDSHEEFNEWFSKDIESHAENKTGIDEKHLSRLHMILKPFMLRRVKKDVENELSDKIEIMMYCPLTNRQRMLYQALRRKISIDDLLYSGGSSASAQTATTTLMNLVMQFRKVCNHPELFERREAKSPYFFQPEPFVLPKFIYRRALLREAFPSRRHLLTGRFYLWHPEYIHHSLFPAQAEAQAAVNSFVSFSRMVGLSPSELFHVMNDGLLARLHNVRQVMDDNDILHHTQLWQHPVKKTLLIQPYSTLSAPSIASSTTLKPLIFTSTTGSGYAHLDHILVSVPETIEHRILRSRKSGRSQPEEFPFTARPAQTLHSLWTNMPRMVYLPTIKVSCRGSPVTCSDRSATYWLDGLGRCRNAQSRHFVICGSVERPRMNHWMFDPSFTGGLEANRPCHGWSNVSLPNKETLISDAGKLQVLDTLLRRLKSEGHRVLIYSQMTRIIDLLEEYMWYRKWTYMRLDGSSKISDRRDMVADFQTRSDIFVFLLSTRAGGLGINLTAADTVIFYDSDWNPTVDQQAMDRAHRLGQTKQVTVYRLICKGTIEERILQRAREKSRIQKLVISGGSFKPDTLKPTEVISLLLDNEEIERKYRQRQAERKQIENEREAERKRKYMGGTTATVSDAKRICLNTPTSAAEYTPAVSPTLTERSSHSGFKFDEASNDGSLVVDDDGPMDSSGVGRFTPLIPGRQRQRPGRGTGRRGRPPGSGKRSRGSSGSSRDAIPAKSNPDSEVGFLSPEMNRSSDTQLDLSFNGDDTPSLDPSPTSGSVRRKPGRPRLKPVGPAHQGSRSSTGEAAGTAGTAGSAGSATKRGRRGAPPGPRLIKPLPVPIGSMSSTSKHPSSLTAPLSPPVKPRYPGQGYYGASSP